MVSSKAGQTIKINMELLLPFKGSEQLHEAFANMRDDFDSVNAFVKQFAEKYPELVRAGRKATLPVSESYAKEIRDWRDEFRRAWRGEESSVLQTLGRLNAQRFSFGAPHGKLIFEPTSFPGVVGILFLRDYVQRRLAVCANPDCHSPYFIKKRTTQKYCTSGPCTEQAQREQKLEWWHKHRGKGST